MIKCIIFASDYVYMMEGKKQDIYVFNDSWRIVLKRNVAFYNKLNQTEQKLFEQNIAQFIGRTKFEAVNTSITDLDKVLVAAGAVIPIFRVDNWHYPTLTVKIYPDAFNRDLKPDGPKDVAGLAMSRKNESAVLISKKHLYHSFNCNSDSYNVAVHEFLHIIDGMDGKVDGVPEVLAEKMHIEPWLQFIEIKINEINQKLSDIDPYGATNPVEFLSVASEYYFENPAVLQQRHPILYNILDKVFNNGFTG